MTRLKSLASALIASSLILSACTPSSGDDPSKETETTKPPAPTPDLDLPKNVTGKKQEKWEYDAKFKVSVEEGTLDSVKLYPKKKAEKDRDKREEEAAQATETPSPTESSPSTDAPTSSSTETANAGSVDVTKTGESQSTTPASPSQSASTSSSASPDDSVDEEKFLTETDPSEGIDEKYFEDGKMSEDETSWSKEKKDLVPNTTYRWVVSTVDADDKTRYYTGTVKTRELKDSEKGGFRSNIGDDQTVGVAAPIIITFNTKVAEKYRDDVEKRLKVKNKDKDVKGSWGWLADDAEGSRLHYRTKDYWPSKTRVKATLDLKDVRLNDDVWSTQKMKIGFKIGRKQETVANASTHHMNVYREGKHVMSFPASLGSAKSPSYNGIHVVMSKHRHYTMTSQRWGYSTPTEYSVRIHNNGEFIHAAPWSAGSHGVRNVSHGCINLTTARAKQYYDSAIYGDPVKVEGSSVTLSKNASDISDWAYSWKEWKQLSALN